VQLHATSRHLREKENMKKEEVIQKDELFVTYETFSDYTAGGTNFFVTK